MEPKEKAYELFMFYYETIPHTHTNLERANIAKKCARKVIAELMLEREVIYASIGVSPGKFWLDVLECLINI